MSNTLCTMIAFVFAASLSQAAEVWQGTARAEFDVKLSGGGFTGHAESAPFEVGGQNEEITVVFLVENADTGKKRRNRDMFKMFETGAFPEIKGVASTSALLDYMLSEDTEPTELTMDLSMHGVTNRVAGELSKIENESGEVLAEFVFNVSLAAFEMKAPTIMLFVKVRDEVRVTATVSLRATEVLSSEP